MDDTPSDAERLFGALIAQLHANGTIDLDDISEMALRLDSPELAAAVRGYAFEGAVKPGDRVKVRLTVVKPV
ncbi:hypothetical protein D3Y57_19220 [Sphingomonas paeninsulae]|uniref:Uncharacterized protein n=1 Tax=Sphingomonas paeninsulae TaxID=2319844 RepID=A0A494TRC7_SPHPE|nr:hypothetical protein [Sphingomonas paeninsulae]AYJ87665.1 hypothetical protein D3Y57_19220 [Sphingomonas paeninsulae]